MVNYYPTPINLSQIIRRYPELEMVDEDEQQRFEDVAYKRKRGKGAPKKAKTKGALLERFSLKELHADLTMSILQRTVEDWARSGKAKVAIFVQPNAMFLRRHHTRPSRHVKRVSIHIHQAATARRSRTALKDSTYAITQCNLFNARIAQDPLSSHHFDLDSAFTLYLPTEVSRCVFSRALCAGLRSLPLLACGCE